MVPSACPRWCCWAYCGHLAMATLVGGPLLFVNLNSTIEGLPWFQLQPCNRVVVFSRKGHLGWRLVVGKVGLVMNGRKMKPGF